MDVIKWRKRDEAIVVTFAIVEIIDEAVIQQIGSKLLESVTVAEETKKLIIDFERVQLISSAILGKFVLLNKKAKAQAIELTFSNMSPSVAEVFRRCGGGGPGLAGQPARPQRPPSSGGAHAKPDYGSDD